jgi:ABC-type microcin C transport system duplicated ATPase subunit YejF
MSGTKNIPCLIRLQSSSGRFYGHGLEVTQVEAKDIQPVRLEARISQPFNSVFPSQQISISQPEIIQRT